MRIGLIGILVCALTACVDRQAACIAATQQPVAALDAEIAALDARLVAGEITDRRSATVRLAELNSAKLKAEKVAELRIAECQRGRTYGL